LGDVGVSLAHTIEIWTPEILNYFESEMVRKSQITDAFKSKI